MSAEFSSMKNNSTRRSFLKQISAWAAAGVGASFFSAGCGGSSAQVKEGLIIGPGKYISQGQTKYVLSIIDLDAKLPRPRVTPLEFFAHGVSPHPLEPEKAALFQKHGPGACLVDLVKGQVIQPIITEPGLEFYGHGAYSRDAKWLYATETDVKDNYRGLIHVRDGKTLTTIGEFPSFGLAPHDCQLVDDGKTLVITNGGGEYETDEFGSVTYVDVASEKLIEKIPLPKDRNAGHLSLTPQGDLAVVSAPREGLDPEENSGGVAVRPAGEEFQPIESPKKLVERMIGETLSLSIHEPSRVVGATTPEGNLLSFWNLDTGELVKSVELPKPRGITLTLDNKFFVVSYDVRADLTFFATDTLERVSQRDLSTSYMTGSHLITYQLA